MPWHWPGHKFLGPGTENLDEEPVDVDDWIARDHDLAYNSAQTSQDIFQADSHAIEDFTLSAIEGNWHSAVSAGLLGIKYGVESASNSVLYPQKMAPIKRTNEDRSPGANNNSESGEVVKRVRREEPDSSMQVTEADDSGGGGSAVSGNPIQICRSSESLAFGKSVIFKKSWLLTTWGFQTNNALQKDASSPFYLKTPLAYIPVDVPAFYINPAEYAQLPNGSNAKKCFVKCTSKGYRFPFETNASTVTSANSEMVLFGQTASHLNQKYNLGFREYQATANDPTKIAAGKNTKQDWIKFFYGRKMSDSPAALPWLQKRLPYYAILHCGNNANVCDLPTLNNDVNTFDLRTAQGIPVLNYDYEFNIAPLKDKTSPDALDFMEGATGTTDLGFKGVRWDIKGKSGHPLYSLVNRMAHVEDARMYEATLEKQEFWRYSSKPEYRLLAQPDCYIGVIPPMSSNPFAATPQFQQVMAYWQFETTLIVDFNLSSSSIVQSKYSAARNRYVPSDNSVMGAQDMQFGFIDGRRAQSMNYEKHEVHSLIELEVAANNQVNWKPKITTENIKKDKELFGATNFHKRDEL